MYPASKILVIRHPSGLAGLGALGAASVVDVEVGDEALSNLVDTVMDKSAAWAAGIWKEALGQLYKWADDIGSSLKDLTGWLGFDVKLETAFKRVWPAAIRAVMVQAALDGSAEAMREAGEFIRRMTERYHPMIEAQSNALRAIASNGQVTLARTADGDRGKPTSDPEVMQLGGPVFIREWMRRRDFLARTQGYTWTVDLEAPAYFGKKKLDAMRALGDALVAAASAILDGPTDAELAAVGMNRTAYNALSAKLGRPATIQEILNLQANLANFGPEYDAMIQRLRELEKEKADGAFKDQLRTGGGGGGGGGLVLGLALGVGALVAAARKRKGRR